MLPKTTFETLALARLKKKGLRITSPRVQVIRCLAESGHALDAYGIHGWITVRGGCLDVVSVYRILETLVELDLVYRVGMLDGHYVKRESDGSPLHRILFVNKAEGKAWEVPDPPRFDMGHTLNEWGVNVVAHQIELEVA